MTPWQFKILIDGECPLCSKEADLLRYLDGKRELLVIEDITAEHFNPAAYGTTMDELMSQIHGVLPNGQLVRGMEAFRQAYAAVGYGWLLAPTRWPIVSPIAERAYRWFARNRLRITRRENACATDRCSRHVS